MYFFLARVAVFVLTAIMMTPVAMARLTGNNLDGNDINDIFQPLPEVITNYISFFPPFCFDISAVYTSVKSGRHSIREEMEPVATARQQPIYGNGLSILLSDRDHCRI